MKKYVYLFVLLCISVQVFSETQADRLRDNMLNNRKYVTVIAHRGDWRGAPENSLQAYQNCIDMGVDMVEIDLKQTKDGVLVIMHDKTLDRTTTGKGKVSDKTYAEIQELYLKAGDGVKTRHKVPTLEEVLNLCKDKILINIDQGYEFFKEAYSLMEKTGTTNQVIIKSGKPYSVVRAENGDVLDKTIYMPIVSIDKAGAEKFIDEWLEHNPVAIECCLNEYNTQAERMLKKLRATNTQIWINSLWASLCAGHEDDRAVELNDPEGSWGWILNQGATLIQCERPQALIKYLKQNKRRKLKKCKRR